MHNAVWGEVRAITQDTLRRAALVEVAAGGDALLARVTPDAVAKLRLKRAFYRLGIPLAANVHHNESLLRADVFGYADRCAVDSDVASHFSHIDQ